MDKKLSRNRLGVIIALVLFLAVYWYLSNFARVANPYTQVYVAGTGNIQGDVNAEYFKSLDASFDIGATKDGVAVFKDPMSAFRIFREKYAESLKLIQDEFHLPKITAKNFDRYKTYAWQSKNAANDSDIKFISSFLDIFENSFK